MNALEELPILNNKQLKYIDFLACGSINDKGRKQSREEFALSIGVSRKTLYRWQENLPEFWATVHTRSVELLEEKVPKVLDAMYQKAISGDVHAARLILNQVNVLKPTPISDTHSTQFSQININLGSNPIVKKPVEG